MSTRKELVKMSSIRLSILRRESPKILVHPRVAIDQILDECRACPDGSLGQKMIDYHNNITYNAEKRLWIEVLRCVK